MEDCNIYWEDDGGLNCRSAFCGNDIWAEPDAEEAWCDHCGRLVKVRNPLIEAGLI